MLTLSSNTGSDINNNLSRLRQKKGETEWINSLHCAIARESSARKRQTSEEESLLSLNFLLMPSTQSHKHSSIASYHIQFRFCSLALHSDLPFQVVSIY